MFPRQLIQEHLLESVPNPERKGCPEEDVLEFLVKEGPTSGSLVLLHVGSCSECYREFLHLQREWIEARQ